MPCYMSFTIILLMIIHVCLFAHAYPFTFIHLCTEWTLGLVYGTAGGCSQLFHKFHFYSDLEGVYWFDQG